MPWSNQSGGGGRRGGGGPWGQGPSGGPHHQPDLEELLKRSQDKLKQVMPGGAGLPGSFVFLVAVGDRGGRRLLRLHLPGQPGRARRRHALRQVDPQRAAGPALPPALSDRGGAPAQGDAPEHHRDRHALRPERAAASPSGQRRAGGEPDADRRREHRRRRFRRLLAHQGRASLPLQHPEPRDHREGGGRERHARDRRPVQHPADPDRGAPEDRAGRAEADAGRARHLRRRHPHRPGAAAEGRPAEPGDRRLPRRAGRARRQGAPAERGVRLRQPDRSGGARRGRAHPAGRQGLQAADRRRGDRPDGALPQGLRGVQEGARGDAQAHVPRDHGARAGRHRQDHPRQQGRAGRGALPAARPAAEQEREGSN